MTSNDFPYARYPGVTMDGRPIVPTGKLPTEPAMPPNRVRAPQLTEQQQAAANIANQVIADAIVEHARARTRATLARYHWRVRDRTCPDCQCTPGQGCGEAP